MRCVLNGFGAHILEYLIVSFTEYCGGVSYLSQGTCPERDERGCRILGVLVHRFRGRKLPKSTCPERGRRGIRIPRRSCSSLSRAEENLENFDFLKGMEVYKAQISYQAIQYLRRGSKPPPLAQTTTHLFRSRRWSFDISCHRRFSSYHSHRYSCQKISIDECWIWNSSRISMKGSKFMNIDEYEYITQAGCPVGYRKEPEMLTIVFTTKLLCK